MPAFFFKFTIMSWQIPPQVEQDIIAGKATFRTHQVGYGGQSVLSVPTNSFVVIFGYDFSPAGGGLSSKTFLNPVDELLQCPLAIRWFGTQQIGIYNGNDFYPFVHNVPFLHSAFSHRISSAEFDDFMMWSVDSRPLSRSLYITSTKDVSIAVGLVLQGNQTQTNLTPVTGNTPFALTYGNSGQANNAELELNLAGTRNFIQPNLPTDIYGFAPISPNNSDQLYWFPDGTFGVIDPMLHIQNAFDPKIDDASNQAAANYKLCLHYALYAKTIPETRG
jgi:hypothetical protein